MENRRQAHLKRVERKGRCTKDTFEIWEKVLLQNIGTKLWDREAVVAGVRVSADGTIVSYNLDIGWIHSTRHRKFLRKSNLPNVECDKVSVENSNADAGVLPGGDSEGNGRRRQSADKGVIPSDTERAGQRLLHR